MAADLSLFPVLWKFDTVTVKREELSCFKWNQKEFLTGYKLGFDIINQIVPTCIGNQAGSVKNAKISLFVEVWMEHSLPHSHSIPHQLEKDQGGD
jgi:hypothetical protein